MVELNNNNSASTQSTNGANQSINQSSKLLVNHSTSELIDYTKQ